MACTALDVESGLFGKLSAALPSGSYCSQGKVDGSLDRIEAEVSGSKAIGQLAASVILVVSIATL